MKRSRVVGRGQLRHAPLATHIVHQMREVLNRSHVDSPDTPCELVKTNPLLHAFPIQAESSPPYVGQPVQEPLRTLSCRVYIVACRSTRLVDCGSLPEMSARGDMLAHRFVDGGPNPPTPVRFATCLGLRTILRTRILGKQ